jgi:SAM-dependent methyltransferase
LAPIIDQNPDLRRLQQEYSRRAENLKTHDLYSLENPAHQWMIADRRKEILSLLEKVEVGALSDLNILEIGCGSGGVMNEFIQLGATVAHLTGVDLLLDRLEQASDDLPDCSWINANGQYLPFQDESFDLLLQFTAFSSILDPGTKKDMAAEMLRVLKPGGHIVWYDFIWNPTNSQTKGIGIKEIKSLFTGCNLFPSRITLAPPLTRLFLPRFPGLVDWLSSLKLFNSHLLVWIVKEG